ncbi:hypothetical protein Ct61P_07921 [Colletotrichum tofieldiae]|nr:hypothetical protein Ct61P_07921 [Colletotrichum tofieldiae]
MSNPVNGHDMDPRRPLFSPTNGVPIPRYGEAYIPHAGWAGAYGGATGYGNYCHYQASPYPYPPYAAAAPPGGQAAYGARTAQGLPALDPRNPAAQLSNSTGGTGCEPGYNYFFPAAHTKIHVFRTTQPPWQLPANARVPFAAFHVPVNTTLAEVLKGFGASNPNPKKNKCFEIVQAGNGKWYKGCASPGTTRT